MAQGGGLENTGTHPRKINQSPDGWRYDIDQGAFADFVLESHGV